MAIGAPGSDFREQLPDGLDSACAVVVQEGEGAPPGVEIAALCQRDHSFGQGSNGFRLGESRLDAPMLNQTARLVGKKSVPVLGCTA
jgi:hypothetical protein